MHWRDLILHVGPGVLIPRPETELIIDIAEEHIISTCEDKDRPQVWADLGTGTGAIAIALSHLLPKVTII